MRNRSDSHASESRQVFPTIENDPRFECPREIRGLRILVVDDDLATLDMLKAALEHCGAEVRISASAAAALEVFRQWKPDVMVSDIAMPDKDGYWLIAEVRALEQEIGQRVRAMALTAYVRVEDRARVLMAGFDMFVPKPVELGEFLGTLRSLVIVPL